MINKRKAIKKIGFHIQQYNNMKHYQQIYIIDYKEGLSQNPRKEYIYEKKNHTKSSTVPSFLLLH